MQRFQDSSSGHGAPPEQLDLRQKALVGVGPKRICGWSRRSLQGGEMFRGSLGRPDDEMRCQLKVGLPDEDTGPPPIAKG